MIKRTTNETKRLGGRAVCVSPRVGDRKRTDQIGATVMVTRRVAEGRDDFGCDLAGRGVDTDGKRDGLGPSRASGGYRIFLL